MLVTIQIVSEHYLSTFFFFLFFKYTVFGNRIDIISS